MQDLSLTYERTISLHYEGDCTLLGILPGDTIYIVETYGDEDFNAYHAVRAEDGAFLETWDEAYGRRAFRRIVPPAGTIKPASVQHATGLNFSGPRLRGLREMERVGALVQQIPMTEKMALVQRLGLDVMPPLLLGLAESIVLSETQLNETQFVICRRLRFAYALSEPQTELHGTTYDYDTVTHYTAHRYSPQQDDMSLIDALDGLPSVALNRPMDCLALGNRLYVADSGGEGKKSAVHIWYWQA